jgi:endoglycosylceramidase
MNLGKADLVYSQRSISVSSLSCYGPAWLYSLMVILRRYIGKGSIKDISRRNTIGLGAIAVISTLLAKFARATSALFSSSKRCLHPSTSVRLTAARNLQQRTRLLLFWGMLGFAADCGRGQSSDLLPSSTDFGVGPSAYQLPTLPLSHRGQFIIDASGRVRIFHGVNMVNKFPPYKPKVLGFGEQDAAILREAGINLVRLGVIYAAVEPVPGTYDNNYLNSIAATVKMLGQYGIASLLDFHQDIFAPTFTGEGFPDWAVQVDDLPVLPNYGFPNDYFGMPALQHAFDHFWADSPAPDGEGLQEHYIAALRHVAKRFRNEPAVVGYDLFNEPFSGTDWKDCYTLPPNPPGPGCPEFDRVPLGAFMAKATEAIKSVDTNHMIFYEPWIFFGLGEPTFEPSPGGSQVGMSFHNYYGSNFNVPIQNAQQQLQATGDALMMTEFGASVDPAPVVEVENLADQAMLSWCYWTYANNTPFQIASTGGLPPTPQQQGIILNLALPRTGSNVNLAVLNAISRPYPQVISGTPELFSFDPKSNRFVLTYSVAESNAEAVDHQTHVVLPSAQYPNGYVATVSGGRIISEPNARLLRVVPMRGNQKIVGVTVVPR